MSSLQTYTNCSEPSPAAVQGGQAVDASPREKRAHDHFSALTPEKKGSTSLWSLCTALYSCALVYGAFSITPDLSAIKSERGCRKMEASGLGLSQGGIHAGLGRRSCRMGLHDDAQLHLGTPISFWRHLRPCHEPGEENTTVGWRMRQQMRAWMQRCSLKQPLVCW